MGKKKKQHNKIIPTDNNDGQCTVQFNCPVVMIPKKNDKTYENLLKENKILQEQITYISGEKFQIEKMLRCKDNEIVECKKTIEFLQKENEELKQRIIHLEQENISIKTNNTEIKKENVRMAKLVDKMYSHKILKVLLIVIQDINDFHRIEDGSIEPYKTYIQNIHTERIKSAHYIYDNDNKSMKEYKCKVALEKIKEFIGDCKLIMDKLNQKAKYNMFTEEFINYLEGSVFKYNLSQYEMNTVEEWWEDQL